MTKAILLVLSLVSLTLAPCGGTAGNEPHSPTDSTTPETIEPDGTAWSGAVRAAERLLRAAANGDVRPLDQLISGECLAKADVLLGAALFSSMQSKPIQLEFPPDFFVVEANGLDEAVLRANPAAGPYLLNGEPTQPDQNSPDIRMIHDQDGEWRMLNCETIKYGE
jgi:hypothetical protein